MGRHQAYLMEYLPSPVTKPDLFRVLWSILTASNDFEILVKSIEGHNKRRVSKIKKICLSSERTYILPFPAQELCYVLWHVIGEYDFDLLLKAIREREVKPFD